MGDDEHDELEAELAARTAGDGSGADDNDDNDDEPTVESLQAELAEARKAQATLKRQLAAAKGQATKAQKRTPAKSDDDKNDDQPQVDEEARAENERLKNQLRDLTAESIARDLKFVDAGDAVRLLDWDEIAEPTDRKEVRDALKRLAKEKPHLLSERTQGRGTDAASGRGKGNGATTMNDLIRQGIKR